LRTNLFAVFSFLPWEGQLSTEIENTFVLFRSDRWSLLLVIGSLSYLSFFEECLMMKKWFLPIAACALAAIVFLPNAFATSPYDLPYQLQWTYLNGGVNDERNGWIEASPDGSAWFVSGWSSYTGANYSMFGDQGNGGSWDSGYGQISPQGVILQGQSLPNITDHQAENQSYTRKHLNIQGTKAVIGWSSNSNQDPDGNGIQGAWWGPTPDGVGRYTFENKGGPMTVRIAPDGSQDLKTNVPLQTTSLRNEALVISQSDDSFWFVGGYQGAGNNVINVGDGTIGVTTGYSPYIGKRDAAGNPVGPTFQGNAQGTSLFVGIDVNETSNKVIAVGYTSGDGVDSTNTYWDADGDGTADLTGTSGLPSTNMGLIGIYDSNTLALSGAVSWLSDVGVDIPRDVAVTPDGGFVVTGYTRGSMTGYTNPASGTNDDIYIAKYNGSGVLQWDWQSQTAIEDEGVSVEVDPDGNIYLGSRVDVVRAGANNSNQPVISGSHAVTKFDSSGTLVWTNTLDQGGTLDDIHSAAAASKNRIYVAAESNPVLGPTWTNHNGYVSTVGLNDDRELLIQKLVPGDFNSSGNVDSADVLAALAAVGGINGSLPATDTYDFDEDGDSDEADIYYFITQIMDYYPGDTNLDGDVDVVEFFPSPPGDAATLTANLGKVGNTFWTEGDFNNDDDVDVFQFDGNGDAQLLTSNLGKGPDGLSDVGADQGVGQAEALYNPATGELFFDVGAGVGVVGLQGPLNHAAVDLGSIFGAPAQNVGGVLAYFNPSGIATGEDSVGVVLPLGLGAGDLQFSYTPIGGQTQQVPVFIIGGVVPEPSTLVLLGMGCLGLVGLRRRR
jgi:hypothetical protein